MITEDEVETFPYLSLVRLTAEALEDLRKSKHPLTNHDFFVYLGDIHNMAGHCVVLTRDGKRHYVGYHTDNFELVPEDEM